MTDHPILDHEPQSEFQAHRLACGDMQRRRRGIPSPSDLQNPGFVVSFPTSTRTSVRITEESTCAGLSDDTASSARPATGQDSPPKKRRGRNSIGVILPGLTLPATLSGYRPQDVGLVTHAAIAILTPHLRDLTAVTIAERVLDVTGALVNGENINRRRVLMLTAAGHTAAYLRRFAPDSPWELLGCEFDSTGGRTDLAWRNPETGLVFFDEIKTHNRPITGLSAVVVGQVKRQAAGGVSQFGDLFAGVRLLPFGSLHLASLIHPDHKQVRLAATPQAPLQVRTQTGGGAR